MIEKPKTEEYGCHDYEWTYILLKPNHLTARTCLESRQKQSAYKKQKKVILTA